jgi:hypothetical protein
MAWVGWADWRNNRPSVAWAPGTTFAGEELGQVKLGILVDTVRNI